MTWFRHTPEGPWHIEVAFSVSRGSTAKCGLRLWEIDEFLTIDPPSDEPRCKMCLDGAK